MLRFDDVTVRYTADGPIAVEHVSLVVQPGERVGLIGPSGAGKSTLLGLAHGGVHPTVGSVLTLDVDTRSLGARTHRATRRRIGSIPQDNAVVGPLRVAQNVAAGRAGEWSGLGAIRALIRPPDLDHIVAALDRVGIADKLWERADRLSGGQQQRVAIARTLHQRADLVLADEPVSSLDPARGAAVLELLTSAVADDPGRSLVMSLHDPGLARRFCTRIVALRDGRVVFDRPADAVSAADLDDVYRLP